jgi:hypothetical protein
MKRFSLLLAAVAATACAAAEIPFVPGQGLIEQLTEAERSVAQLAIDALAADLRIERDRILVDTIRAVDWPDSSVGCPKPDMAYLQVITPGHKITLRVDGTFYVVNEANGRAVVCHRTKAQGGITSKRELVFGGQILEARKDLASRTGVPEREIQFVSGEGRSWTDASLGCPEPGITYPLGKVEGWVLTFKLRTREFTYHTDLNRTIPCPGISAS